MPNYVREACENAFARVHVWLRHDLRDARARARGDVVRVRFEVNRFLTDTSCSGGWSSWNSYIFDSWHRQSHYVCEAGNTFEQQHYSRSSQLIQPICVVS